MEGKVTTQYYTRFIPFCLILLGFFFPFVQLVADAALTLLLQESLSLSLSIRQWISFGHFKFAFFLTHIYRTERVLQSRMWLNVIAFFFIELRNKT